MARLRTEADWLSPAEAAEYLRVAPSTIYRWARSGLVNLYRIGEGATRLKRSELDALAKPLPGASFAPPDLARREVAVSRLLGIRSRLASRNIDLSTLATEGRRELEDHA